MERRITGRKVKMSQVFAPETGEVTPVTLVELAEVPEDLAEGKAIKITGISKGKGFTGVMKRWRFAGGPATHGQSTKPRHAGSIGATTTPGRVHKGKKMAGRKGGGRVTVRGLKIIELDKEKKIAKISGAIPGPRRGEITIRY